MNEVSNTPCFFSSPYTLSAWLRGDLIRSNYFIDSFSGPYHCSFPINKTYARMNNVVRHSGVPSPTKKQKTVSLWFMFMSCSQCPFHSLCYIPHKHSYSLPSLPFQPPPSSFMITDTQAQQAFRSEPRNLTVQMGARAVLRCEVLRASGTVQWVKDGLLLGPQRSLPGFSRYSMIGNPKRGKQTQGTVCSVLDFYAPIQTE